MNNVAAKQAREIAVMKLALTGVNRTPSELMYATPGAYMNGYKVEHRSQYDTVIVLAHIYFAKPVEIEGFLVIDSGVLYTIDYNEEIATVATLAILSGKSIPTITAGFDTDKGAPCNGKSFDVFVTKAGEKVIIDQNGHSIVVTDEELVDIATVCIDGTADTIVSAIERRDFSSLKVTTLFAANFIKD